MATRFGGAGPSHLAALFRAGTVTGWSDRELLDRFVDRGEPDDEGAELAFAALVERHGPMVLSVCREVLGDRHDAEDAFQAAFLVLASRARSIRRRESVAAWLHGVALRVAACARSRAARRRRHERKWGEMAARAGGGGADGEDRSPSLESLDQVLHQELQRLPDRYSAAVILCHLEGMTHEQAARQLGWPVGTVRSRLARGRDRLRDQLTRRGFAPAVLLPTLNASRTPEGIPSGLTESAVRAAIQFAAGEAAAAGTGLAVLTLARGVLKVMILSKQLKIAGALVVAGSLATGAVGFAFQEVKTVPGSGQAGAKAAVSPRVRLKGRLVFEAEAIAEKVLKTGSDLFDAKKADALAATYTEDGTIHLTGKKEDHYQDDVKRGRAEIEEFYRGLFKDGRTIDSENFVESARLIAPDLLVINGRFRPNLGEKELPFVQMRIKEGDQWLLSKLWLFLSPQAK
jgi:RNA polymerase sigma factor (sigma-70 family)